MLIKNLQKENNELRITMRQTTRTNFKIATNTGLNVRIGRGSPQILQRRKSEEKMQMVPQSKSNFNSNKYLHSEPSIISEKSFGQKKASLG